MIAILCSIPYVYERIPGTLYFDQRGMSHGTGVKDYFYESGQPMIKETYFAGLMVRSRWYRPDQTLIDDVDLVPGRDCVGYYLYQDGTIRSKMTYRLFPLERVWTAHGRTEKFDELGGHTSTEWYNRGILERVVQPPESDDSFAGN